MAQARFQGAGQITGIPVTALVVGVPYPAAPPVGVPPAALVSVGIPADVPQQGVPISDVPGGAPPADTGPSTKSGSGMMFLFLAAAAIYFVAK
jgi:hypothetical protein